MSPSGSSFVFIMVQKNSGTTQFLKWTSRKRKLIKERGLFNILWRYRQDIVIIWEKTRQEVYSSASSYPRGRFKKMSKTLDIVQTSVVPIFITSLHLCQINWDLNENWNLSSWGPNLSPQVVHSRLTTKIGYCETWDSSNFHVLPISLPNQLRSSWNLKLKLWRSKLITPSCLPPMTTIRLGVV